MYEKTSGLNWRDNAGWMNETLGHYQWYGISCDIDGFVTNIDLRGNNLLGQFPVYKRNNILYNLSIQERPVIGELRPMFRHWMLMKDGLANLFKFKTFDLSNNKLSTIEYVRCTIFVFSTNLLSWETN
jgi:Leucine-rich repeat (LRR) protein